MGKQTVDARVNSSKNRNCVKKLRGKRFHLEQFHVLLNSDSMPLLISLENTKFLNLHVLGYESSKLLYLIRAITLQDALISLQQSISNQYDYCLVMSLLCFPNDSGTLMMPLLGLKEKLN